MMMFNRTASLIALMAASLAANAQARDARPTVPDRLELGRDARGEPCVASRYWGDPLATDYFSDSFSVTCRGATAGRPLGFVRSFKITDAAKVEAGLECAAASNFTIPSLGSVSAQRCVDKALGLETVVTRFDRGVRRYMVSAVPTAQGPAEEALRTFAGLQAVNSDRGRKTVAAINPQSLPAALGGAGLAALVVDPSIALQQGLRFIRQGLHMEASRVLSDTLSRLPADAPVGTRIELLLVSGLADSNLRFFDSAAANFAKADQLLAENPGIDGAAVLARKRENYTALDLLNRRNFTNAVSALNQISSEAADASQPLTDPTTIRAINQRSDANAGISGAVAVPDVKSLSQIVIDTQANWARSVALLAQSNPDGAKQALDRADRSFSVLKGEKVDQKQVMWLEARIERQRARIAARQGNIPLALESLDKAIASLNKAGADGSGIGPTLAETQIERAAMASRTNMDRAKVLAQFDGAVDSLVSSSASGSVLPPAIEQYLDLLVVDAKDHPEGNAGERFFRAIQAVGEPAVARQFTQLQSIVTSDETLASKVQDRGEVEREITQLRYQISSMPPENADLVKELDKKRSDAETRLLSIDAELQASNAFSAVDDRPATIAEIQSMLKEGEAYFKLTEVRNYAFGILIDAQGYQIFRAGKPLVDIKPITDLVRKSIDGGGAKLAVFDVASSYALYRLLAEPVSDRLMAAKTVIVDPSGPLEKLPLGVLVTDIDSVRAYMAGRKGNAYDYSKVNFLAKQVSISSALSPRSFIVARKLPSSNAPQPFMGFAQHMPPALSGSFGGQQISVGTGCIVEKSAIAALSNQLSPINSSELDRAASALGVTNAPSMIGAEFSDSAVSKRTDLDQFQVLHFATHGLTEGQWGCAKSPPSLVTSFGDEESDGILSFSEIAQLRLNANLVVLSACDTASGISEGQAQLAGQEEAGATLQGLVRAFLAANARAVLTTYWPISDEGESEALVAGFYRAGRTSDIATALRTAQTDLMNQPKFSHPIYWGAFFVVGDASKSLLSGSALAAVVASPTGGQ
jgi:CHAT domain-containing protein/tetratricopeptide (TPR) repeat protein